MSTFSSSIKLWLCFMACFFLLLCVGCETNYYEAKEGRDVINPLFEEGTVISSDFDWGTTRLIQVNIAVDDQYNGSYHYMVNVFDVNPIFSEGANPLASGVAKQNKPYSGRISVPRSVSRLYVRQTDPTGKSIITSASVENNTLTVDFGGGQKVQTKSLRSGMPLNNTTSLTAEHSTPTDAIEITNEKNGNSFVLDPTTTGKSRACVIKKGTTYTGNLSFNGWGQGVSLYLEGTLVNTAADIRLGEGDKIIIQDGGRFVSQNDLFIGGNGNCVVAIAPSGELDINYPNKLSLEFYDYGQLINEGIFKAYSITIPSFGQVYNYGEVKTEMLTLRSEGVVTNDRELAITELIGYNGTIINNCNLTIEKAMTNGAKLFLNEGSLFTVKQTMTAGGTIFNFASDAIMDAEEIIFTTQLNEMNGVGDKFALARLKNIVLGNSNSECVYYKGKLEIEWTNQTMSNLDQIISPARFLEKSGDKSLLSIASTSCNEGGNNQSPNNPPSEVKFPIISKGQGLTYLFEDNWPNLGDYDMNDLVVDIAPVYLKDLNNKVESMILNVDLRAVGASKRLALGIQLEEVDKSNIVVSRSNRTGLNGQVFKLAEELEADQSKPVIPVFDDVHEALGLSSPQLTNTVKGGLKKDPASVAITVSFRTPVDASALTVDKLNVFVVCGGYNSKRSEIHLLGFPSTEKADKSKFGQGSDNSTAGVTYRSTENLIWGLAIPISSYYPLEWIKITSAFPKFEAWVLSGGKSNEDWYKYPDKDAFTQ